MHSILHVAVVLDTDDTGNQTTQSTETPGKLRKPNITEHTSILNNNRGSGKNENGQLRVQNSKANEKFKDIKPTNRTHIHSQ